MEKIKITSKFIKTFKNQIVIPYCEAHYLLNYNDCDYYGSGVYGWSYDAYIIDYDTIIVTGYRPTGNIRPDYALIKKYENKAENIVLSNLNYDTKKEKIQKLQLKFIDEILKN